MMFFRPDNIKMLLLAAALVAICAGCGLLGLPFAVTEDVLDGTGVIVQDVGEAL